MLFFPPVLVVALSTPPVPSRGVVSTLGVDFGLARVVGTAGFTRTSSSHQSVWKSNFGRE